MKATRRNFLAATGVALTEGLGARAAAAGHVGSEGRPASSEKQEALRELCSSLSSEQRQVIVLPRSDERRLRVDANFHVTRPELGDSFYSQQQRALVRQVLAAVLSPEGAERMARQMRDDAGGLSGYSIAFFQDEGSEHAPQWLLTGRHVCLRAEGSLQRLPPGPLVYGHGVWGAQASLYAEQMKRANQLYRALEPQQQRAALLQDAPFEEDVQLPARGAPSAGLALSHIDSERRSLLQHLVRSLTELFPPPVAQDLEQRLLSPPAGSSTTLRFYREDAQTERGPWTIWRLESPRLVWHFRGAPHVHAYLQLG